MRTGTLLLAAVLSAASAPAWAQGHQGFWIGFGLGGGATGGSNSKGGGAAYLRLGGTPSHQLLVGGEALGWGRTDNGVTVTQGNATADILFYPSPTRGFFLKTGLGFATATASTTGGNVTVTATDNGLGMTLGAGFDVRLGRNIYLTPNFDALIQVINSTTETLYLFTIGLTWH